MVAALEWIQRNIEQFGGDPTKVVISGQSAGAGAVSLLQASPLAAGLFRGVVAMSGGTWRDGGQGGVPLRDAERIGLDVQEALHAGSIAEMRDVPADRLLALQAERQLMYSGGGTIRARTNIDGYFLPDTPANLFAAQRANDVPVIAGFANDEGRHPLRQAESAADYRAIAHETYGGRVEQFLALYPVPSDADIDDTVRTVARDASVMRTARSWALAQSGAMRSPVFVYNLSRLHAFNPDHLPVDRPDQVGAYHTSDVPFWFGTLDAFNLFRPMRLWSTEGSCAVVAVDGVTDRVRRDRPPGHGGDRLAGLVTGTTRCSSRSATEASGSTR